MIGLFLLFKAPDNSKNDPVNDESYDNCDRKQSQVFKIVEQSGVDNENTLVATISNKNSLGIEYFI